jgi:hypothetical protein
MEHVVGQERAAVRARDGPGLPAPLDDRGQLRDQDDHVGLLVLRARPAEIHATPGPIDVGPAE